MFKNILLITSFLLLACKPCYYEVKNLRTNEVYIVKEHPWFEHNGIAFEDKSGTRFSFSDYSIRELGCK